MNDKKAKLPRREFLANLLFAGGVLSVCGLQDSYDIVARRDPKKDGWELPDDLTESRPDDAEAEHHAASVGIHAQPLEDPCWIDTCRERLHVRCLICCRTRLQ